MDMQRKVSVRELNQRTSAVLSEVAGGAALTITSSGRPVARLVPIRGEPSALDDLVATGRASAPTVMGPVPMYIGPRAGEEADWPEVTVQAVEQVTNGPADEAVVMCWTGTGCTLAANKVPGIRAALCHDAETARGARVWNHANVLALSLRSTSDALAREILDAWFATPFSDDDWNRRQMERIRDLERRYSRPAVERHGT